MWGSTWRTAWRTAMREVRSCRFPPMMRLRMPRFGPVCMISFCLCIRTCRSSQTALSHPSMRKPARKSPLHKPQVVQLSTRAEAHRHDRHRTPLRGMAASRCKGLRASARMSLLPRCLECQWQIQKSRRGCILPPLKVPLVYRPQTRRSVLTTRFLPGGKFCKRQNCLRDRR